MEDPFYDCTLDSEEKQVASILEQYEKQSREHHGEQTSTQEDEYVEGDRTRKQNANIEETSDADIEILGFKIGQNLGMWYIVIVLVICALLVHYSKHSH